MQLLINIVLISASTFLLVRSADLLIISITRLSRHFHLSEFITGVLLLGLATSTPELFIGISSAASGNAPLAAGNLIGATILLFALLAGFAAIVVVAAGAVAWQSGKGVSTQAAGAQSGKHTVDVAPLEA